MNNKTGAVPGGLTVLLRDLSPMALAFSGGLDSRFLAHAARLVSLAGEGPEIRLFHFAGPHVPALESAAAGDWAAANGLAFTAVPVDPLCLPEVRANGKDRCYHCKRLMFTLLAEAAGKRFSGKSTLCDGSNASDVMLFRPGIKALRELGVRSPLSETGMDKNTVRAAAAATGLDDPGQRARPCMLTRFAYDLSPSSEALAAVDKAERSIAALLSAAFAAPAPDFRLRLVRSSSGREGALPYAPELHLTARPDGETACKLEKAVIEQGFTKPALVVLDAVSGHYDRL